MLHGRGGEGKEAEDNDLETDVMGGESWGEARERVGGSWGIGKYNTNTITFA